MSQEITMLRKNSLNSNRLIGISALLAGGCLLATFIVILVFIPDLLGDPESKFGCIASNLTGAGVVYVLWIIEALALIPVIVKLASISAVYKPKFRFWQMFCGFVGVFFMLCSYLVHLILLIGVAMGSIGQVTFDQLTNLAYNLEPIGFPLLIAVNILFGIATRCLGVLSYQIILWLSVGILSLAAFGGMLIGVGFVEIGGILVGYGTWIVAGVTYIFIGTVFVRTKQTIARKGISRR